MSEAEAAHLMVDAPGCFELVSEQPATREIVTPPANKRIATPRRRK